MTSDENNDLESSISRYSINMASFPFHNLPVFVQWKILKQYIPILCKAFVLQDIPEFSNLLQYPQSWTKPSKIFFDFFSLLCSLKKGMYINLDNFSKKAYYVSMDQREVTFTLCCLDQTLFDYKVCAISSECPINPFKSPLRFPMDLFLFQKFLKIFLDNYTLSVDNEIKVYEFRDFFFVNYSTNKVCWTNGKIYDITDRVGIIKISELRGYQIILKDNYMIELRVIELRDPFRNKHYGTLKTKILTPMSLETFLLSEKEKIYTFRVICEIDFHFMADDLVKLNVKMDNPRMCLDYLDENLLDSLPCIKDVFKMFNII